MTPKPRYHTPRNLNNRTLGGKSARVAAALGKPYMPWQRMAADVAQEVDYSGNFIYHTVIITVPRQSGKTTQTLSLGLHRTMITPGGKIWYTAQSGQAARERFLQELAPPVQRNLPGLFALKRGAGDTRLILPSTGAQFRPHPPTDKYLHGEQSDLNLIDEPWAYTEVQGDALMQAIVPTQNTRPNAQTIMLSTMGDANSTWWHDIVDKARAMDDPRVCVIDWGLDESIDAGDVEAVINAHPAVGHTINPQAIYDAHAALKPSEFARAYANQRTATRAAVFDGDTIAAVLHDGDTIASDSPVVFGVAVAWDRSETVIAAAGYSANGRPVAEIVDARPGTRWAIDRIPELDRSHSPRAIMLDAHSPAAVLATDPHLDDFITTPTPREIAAGTGALLDGIRDGALTLRTDRGLASSLARLTLRNVGDLGQMMDRKRSPGSIAPLEAAALALTGLTLSSETAPPPTIWT